MRLRVSELDREVWGKAAIFTELEGIAAGLHLGQERLCKAVPGHSRFGPKSSTVGLE